MQFERKIIFDAQNELEALEVAKAVKIILDSIKEKKHLVKLGQIVAKKPGLIEKGIPFLNML